MFDFVRKHNKLFQIILVLLILPSFVLFGVHSFEDKAGDDEIGRAHV